MPRQEAPARRCRPYRQRGPIMKAAVLVVSFLALFFTGLCVLALFISPGGGAVIPYLLSWVFAFVAGVLGGIHAARLRHVGQATVVFGVMLVALVASCGGAIYQLGHDRIPCYGPGTELGVGSCVTYQSQAEADLAVALTVVPVFVPPIISIVAALLLSPRKPKPVPPADRLEPVLPTGAP